MDPPVSPAAPPNGVVVADTFQWLAPPVDTSNKLGPGRMQETPGPRQRLGSLTNSPLMRAKNALRRTFSGGNHPGGHQDVLERELRVKEAQDACCWLKSGGFPQYAQKYEAGEFPIDLMKLEVERDHRSVLNTADIESLKKRLNALNQCADLLEEVLAREDDSEDEDNMRALSERWQFQKKEKRWSRRPVKQYSSLQNVFTNHQEPAPLLVSELSSSPTQSDNGLVKTYTFCPAKRDSLPLSPPPVININGKQASPGASKSEISNHSSEKVTSDEGDLECLSSFASGILDAFDQTMINMNKTETLSRSLPNVFTTSSLIGMSASQLSSQTTSSSSVMDDFSKEAGTAEMNFMMDEEIGVCSPLHSTRSSKEGTLEFMRIESNGSSNNWGPSPDSVLTYEEVESPGHQHWRMERRSTLGSTDSGSYLEQVEVVPEKQRSKSMSNTSVTRAKWHSFQRQHSFRQAFKPCRTLIPIEELSVGQIMVLRKLSLVKLTALIELHNGKTNISRILRVRRLRYPDARGRRVFGVPLRLNVQRHGRALPRAILQAMDYLQENGMDTVGLFRRTAAKARVEGIREEIEANPESVDYSQYGTYEIADLLKLYFRDLPEPLLTNKMSEVLFVVHENIPQAVRLQALQAVMLLLPDENREALQTLLHFLSFVASHSKKHQMDINNLAVCLAPTLFSLTSPVRASPLVRRGSLRKTAVNHSPNLLAPKELTEHLSSSQCLTELIHQQDKVFMVAADMMQVCKFSHLEFGDPVPYHDLGRDKLGNGGYHTYIDESVATLFKEQKRRFRGWVHCDPVKGVEIAYNKVDDGVPLKLWRGTTDIAIPPRLLLQRLWDERYLWDGKIEKGRKIASLDYQTEVFQYVTPSMLPCSARDHCILRGWRQDPSSQSYVITATSVSHPCAGLLAGVRATELAMRYLIEPLPNNCSRLTVFCRVDMRGRSAEYYNAYGRYLASSIRTLRDSVKRLQELKCLETPV